MGTRPRVVSPILAGQGSGWAAQSVVELLHLTRFRLGQGLVPVGLPGIRTLAVAGLGVPRRSGNGLQSWAKQVMSANRTDKCDT